MGLGGEGGGEVLISSIDSLLRPVMERSIVIFLGGAPVEIEFGAF